MYVPQNDGLQAVVDGLYHQWGFPQTVGAFDGSHILTIILQESASHRKGITQ